MNAALDRACQEMHAAATRRQADREALAQSPASRRLVAIMENNHRAGDLLPGWGGFAQAVTMDRRKLKRIAAERLLYVRANREACKRLGMDPRGADARNLARVRVVLAEAGSLKPQE